MKVLMHECSVLSLTSVMRLVAHQYNVAQQNRQAQLNLIKHNHRVEQPITELQLRILWHIWTVLQLKQVFFQNLYPSYQISKERVSLQKPQ